MVKLRIREILKQRGITQAELARRLGVTPITVNGWATGRRLPSLEILDRIAEITSTPITQFFASTTRPQSFPEASNKQQPIINQQIRNTLMKKLLLLLLMVVSTAVGSWAEERTYDFTAKANADGWPTSVNSATTVTSKKTPELTITFYENTKWNSNAANSSIAFLKNQSGYIEVHPFEGYVITSVQFFIPTGAAKAQDFDIFIGDANVGKVSATSAGAVTNTVTIPKENQTQETLKIQKIKSDKQGTIGKLILNLEKVETDKSQPATKITFDPVGGELASATTVHLSTDGLDEEGNMLPIYYTTDGTDADASSAKYDVEAGILVDRAMTINAYVNDEVTASATYTIAAQVPAAPVVKYNNETIDGDVHAYYGDKIVVIAAMANQLIVESTEDGEFTVEGNTYEITAHVNEVLYSIKGVNDDGEGEAVEFTVYINKPEAPVVKFGETTVSEDGEFTVQKGTVVSVAPGKGSNEVVVTDEEENIVELTEDGTFTLSEKGEYMYMITSKSPVEGVVDENSIIVSFNVIATQNKVATFDFTSANAYGMETLSGNTSKYEENIKSISNAGVTLLFADSYRHWTTGGNFELRVARKTTNIAAGVLTFVVPSNCKITKITFNGAEVGKLICENSNDCTVSASTTSYVVSVKDVIELDEITVNGGTESAQRINTITVEYVSDEAEDPVAPVVAIDPDATGYSDAKFNITADKGLHIIYSYEHRVPSAKMSVASADEPAWTTVEHYNHTITPSTHVATLNPGETVRYAFMAYNPDTQAKSPVVYKSVKADGSLSGVEDVEVESGVEAEYFNLQGVRVAAPLAPGLYIERRGNKAVKVRIN